MTPAVDCRPRLRRSIPAACLVALAMLALHARIGHAQNFAVASVPAVNSGFHGNPINIWFAQVGGAGTPTTWRIASVTGPPGLVVTTPAGNTTMPGGPPTPFEPWFSPGANFLSAFAMLDPPPSIELYTIIVDVMGPSGTASASNLLIVSHGAPMVLPFVPLGGGAGPGNSWNARCNPSPLRIFHGAGAAPAPPGMAAVGALGFVPNPGSPPFPAGATARAINSSGGLGIVPPIGALPININGNFAITCGPLHTTPFSGPTIHFIDFRLQSAAPARVEIETCTVYCYHDSTSPFGLDAMIGIFAAADGLTSWLADGELVELPDPARLALIAKALAAADAASRVELEEAACHLGGFQRELDDLGPTVATDVATMASLLSDQLLEAIAAVGGPARPPRPPCLPAAPASPPSS